MFSYNHIFKIQLTFLYNNQRALSLRLKRHSARVLFLEDFLLMTTKREREECREESSIEVKK
jgi:hypothetical protein